MPLPISSQVYMPNPQLAISGIRAGKEVGSTFSNIVEGAMEGFDFVTGQRERLQQMELRPKEQARREKETALQERRINIMERQGDRRDDLNEKREDRLANNQEFEHDYKNKTLDIQQSELLFRKDKFNKEFSLKRSKAIAAAREEANEALVVGAIDSMIVDGEPHSMLEAIKEPKGAARFANQLRKDPEIANDLIRTVEANIANGKYDAETVQKLDDFVRSIEYNKKIISGRENAEKYVPIMSDILGAAPEEDGFLSAVRGEDGSLTILQQTPRTLGRNALSQALGGKHVLGVVDGTDPKVNEAVRQGMAAQNQKVRYNAAISKVIKSDAEMKVKRQQMDNQQPQDQERPTKLKTRQNSEKARLQRKRVLGYEKKEKPSTSLPAGTRIQGPGVAFPGEVDAKGNFVADVNKESRARAEAKGQMIIDPRARAEREKNVQKAQSSRRGLFGGYSRSGG